MRERTGYCQKQIVIVMTADNPIVVDGVTGEGPVQTSTYYDYKVGSNIERPKYISEVYEGVTKMPCSTLFGS